MPRLIRIFFFFSFFFAIIVLIPTYILYAIAYPTADVIGISHGWATVLNLPINFLIGYLSFDFLFAEWIKIQGHSKVFKNTGKRSYVDGYHEGLLAAASAGLSADEHMSVSMAVSVERERSATLLNAAKYVLVNGMTSMSTDQKMQGQTVLKLAVDSFEASRD